MKTKSNLNKRKVIGYSLLTLYIVAVITLLFFCASLNMLPAKYLIIIGVLMAVLALIMAIMHKRQIPSICASVLSVLLIMLSVMGCVYIQETHSTIRDVTTVDVRTDVVSVYVLNADSAEKVDDAADYQFGIANKTDRANTDKTITEIESELGQTLEITEYEDMFAMMDDLQSQKINAVIMNEAYVGALSGAEKYAWVENDLRKLKTLEHHTEKKQEVLVLDDMPETFVMYLSGIDTYNGVTASSRSDVNILAVLNTKTRNMLLLSTPRDAYLSFAASGGAKDKLTHAGIYGVEASIDALEQLYGTQVDYYLRINFSGFIDIIDALGGIDVNSDYAFSVYGIKDYQVGLNHLAGEEALAFARERYSFIDGDTQRAKNQMEVIRAMVQKAASSSLLTNYTSVMDAISGSFDTSMPSKQITSLVKMQLSDMSEWNVTSFATSGTDAYAETFSMPGQQLYVVELSQESIEQAKKMIADVYGQ